MTIASSSFQDDSQLRWYLTSEEVDSHQTYADSEILLMLANFNDNLPSSGKIRRLDHVQSITGLTSLRCILEFHPRRCIQTPGANLTFHHLKIQHRASE